MASSHAAGEAEAVEEIRAGLDPDASVVLLFCSSRYDPARLGPAIRDAFDGPVIACSTAGQIGTSGYQRGGLTAASLASDELRVRPHLIAPLSSQRERAAKVAAEIRAAAQAAPGGRRSFGLLLVDGLASAEEGLVATLYQSLGNLPIVGGSAGDDLSFERTWVYWDGAFVSNAAVLAVFETTLRFTTFKLQHFRPTDRKVVTTAADPATRTVKEINGLPAAEGYAEVLGHRGGPLDAAAFSRNPLMLRIGSDHYLRSVQQVNPDGSLRFYCAIDEGLVLSVGEALDPVAALEEALAEATRGLGEPAVVIACECILRRLEHEQRGIEDRVGAALAARRVIGFHTYGEQFNAVHVNQTLTGVALAG